MNKQIFKGTATALITPFTADGKDVEYSQFEWLINFQIENGINALVVAGTTGESPVLSPSEKRKLFNTAVRCADKKIPIIAGTGSNNTEEAVRKSNDAEKEGVDGLLIVTPYYNKCTDEGIIKHYFYIADRVSVPIIVYNVPSRTGVNIKPDVYKTLSEHKNIVAVKEASGNISEFIKTSALCQNNLTYYSGNDDQIISMMSEGASGVVSVASNIIPGIICEITELCLRGDFNAALTLHNKYLNLINLLFCEVNPIPVKYACNLLFRLNNILRLPLTAIKESNKIKIADEIEKLNIK